MKRLMIPLIALCALASACASTARWDREYEQAPEPARSDWHLVKDRCTGCHSLNRVFTKMPTYKDRGDIEFTVEDMADRPSSGIPWKEVPRIVDALEWYRARPQ